METEIQPITKTLCVLYPAYVIRLDLWVTTCKQVKGKSATMHTEAHQLWWHLKHSMLFYFIQQYSVWTLWMWSSVLKIL